MSGATSSFSADQPRDAGPGHRGPRQPWAGSPVARQALRGGAGQAPGSGPGRPGDAATRRHPARCGRNGRTAVHPLEIRRPHAAGVREDEDPRGGGSSSSWSTRGFRSRPPGWCAGTTSIGMEAATRMVSATRQSRLARASSRWRIAWPRGGDGITSLAGRQWHGLRPADRAGSGGKPRRHRTSGAAGVRCAARSRLSRRHRRGQAGRTPAEPIERRTREFAQPARDFVRIRRPIERTDRL